MTRRANLRASDADREQFAERLRHATVEGRLLAEELEHRLERVFCARTYGELDSLVSDLPAAPIERRRPRGVRPWVVPAIGLALAIPLVMAVVAMAFVLVTGLLTMWIVWLAIAAWLIGYRGHYYRGGRSRQYRAGRSHARPGLWL